MIQRMVGWILWHINLLGYFMPNSVYTNIRYMIGKRIVHR